MNLAEV